MYSIFGAQIAAKKSQVALKPLDENTLGDLEILSGQKSKLQRHLVALFEPYLHTAIGKVQLQKMLCEPSTNIEALHQCQAPVKKLLADVAKLEQLNKKLAVLTKAENEMLWFWNNIDEKTFEQLEAIAVPTMFFQLPSPIMKKIKKYPALTEFLSRGCHITSSIIPLVGIFSALYFINEFSNGNNPFAGLEGPALQLKIDTAALGLFSPLLWYAYAKQNVAYNESTNEIHTKMNGVAQFTDVAIKVLGKDAFGSDENYENLAPLIELLNTPTFKNDPSFFAYKGRAITAFTLMSEVKAHFVSMLEKLGKLDAYTAIASFMQAQEKNSNGKYCFPTYIENDTPYLNLTGYWHPFLNPSTVVPNDIELGCNVARNIIVTGPNAGGKSTSLKSMTLAIIMAQTLGIAPAKTMTLTPFKIVNTYMNIADDAGSESLFQAEMHRASKLIESVKNQKGKDFIFVIMDELFTGTNPLEGASAAYGILRKLVSYQNCMLVFATHFKELTELERETGGLIRNFKVWVDRQASAEQGKVARIIYPYKLDPGISDQTVALDLLALEGFDPEILSQSNAQLERLKQAKQSAR